MKENFIFNFEVFIIVNFSEYSNFYFSYLFSLIEINFINIIGYIIIAINIIIIKIFIIIDLLIIFIVIIATTNAF